MTATSRIEETGLAPVRSTGLAASLMWVGGMASSLPLLMVAVWTWASREQRTVERAELTDTRQ